MSRTPWQVSCKWEGQYVFPKSSQFGGEYPPPSWQTYFLACSPRSISQDTHEPWSSLVKSCQVDSQCLSQGSGLFTLPSGSDSFKLNQPTKHADVCFFFLFFSLGEFRVRIAGLPGARGKVGGRDGEVRERGRHEQPPRSPRRPFL